MIVRAELKEKGKIKLTDTGNLKRIVLQQIYDTGLFKNWWIETRKNGKVGSLSHWNAGNIFNTFLQILPILKKKA